MLFPDGIGRDAVTLALGSKATVTSVDPLTALAGKLTPAVLFSPVVIVVSPPSEVVTVTSPVVVLDPVVGGGVVTGGVDPPPPPPPPALADCYAQVVVPGVIVVVPAADITILEKDVSPQSVPIAASSLNNQLS